MKILKIEIPEGYEIEEFDIKTGKVSFRKKPKNAMERIKTIDDILDDNGVTMFEINWMFKNVPEHLKHQYIAELLTKSLNEVWIPNWDDRSEYKYYPWFKMGGSSGFRFDDTDNWAFGSSVGSRLCFKSRDLADYAGKQFTDLYKKFMLIEK